MSKTAKSVKAICRKNDKFLCVESPDSNALFFPSIAVSSFRKPDIEQALEKLLEITNNDELAISRQLAEGQSTNPRYYLCYCDYEINFLANGQCAIWLTQQEMAYHKWIPEDQKMADLVMSPLFEKVPIQRRQQSSYEPMMRLAEHWKKSISTTPKNKGIKAIQAM